MTPKLKMQLLFTGYTQMDWISDASSETHRQMTAQVTWLKVV